jgi:M6 family metalloprotease-like protein
VPIVRSIRVLAAVAALCVAGLVSGPPAGASTIEPAPPALRALGATVLEGTVRLVVADPAGPTQAADPSADRKPAPGQGAETAAPRYDLALVTPDKVYVLEGGLEEARPDTRVRVTGTVTGNRVRVTEVRGVTPQGTTVASTSPAAEVPPAIPTAGTTRILTILAHWSGPDHVTQASARAQMYTDAGSWFRDVSYGAVSLAGDVTPWLRIAGPTGGRCYADRDNVMTQARTAAKAAGYDAGAYGAVVVYFPRNGWQAGSDCDSFGGWAHVGGTEVWIHGEMNRRVVTHELGHSFGLNHAHSYLCVDGLSGSCSFSDYGDEFDSMGNADAVGHFNAALKDRLGWMPGRTVDLTAGGTARLAPVARDAVAISGASVRVSPTRTYWLEYRQRLDFDAGLPAEAVDGVSVRVVDPGLDPLSLDSTHLLDARPLDPLGLFAATLRPGDGWTSPEGFRFSVTAADATGATATVGRAARPACVDAALEPDDTAATARTIPLGAAQKRAFCTQADQDWVKFAASAGTRYRLTTANLGGSTDTVLSLFASNGTTLLASNDDDPTAGSLASGIDFTPTTSGTYLLQVTDFGGSYGLARSYDLRVGATDATRPTVVARTPAAGGRSAAVSGVLRATFSEPVVGVHAGTFTLRHASTGVPVPGTVSRVGTTQEFVLDPTTDLAADTRYTATLVGGPTAVRDTSGNTLASLTWSVTTGPAPAVAARTPRVDGVAVARAADVRVTFTEKVTGVGAGTFTLTNRVTGVPVPATVTRIGFTNEYVLNPGADLATDARYTVALIGGTSAIRDLAGNPLVTARWSFATGPAPTVVARTPAVDALGVARTANVTATFSEPVTGVSAASFTLKNRATGAGVPAVVTRNAATNQYVLDPSAPLAAGTTYTVVLIGAHSPIRDVVGNPLATTSWSFRTGS